MKPSIGGFRHVLPSSRHLWFRRSHILLPSMLQFLLLLGTKILVLSSGNFWACATSLRLGWHAHPRNGSADKSNHNSQSLRPVQTALRLCFGSQKAWVRQADVLRTKHQQAKSLCPHKQADVLLTKHQHARCLWPHKQDKTVERKTRHSKWAGTITHYSIQKQMFIYYYI